MGLRLRHLTVPTSMYRLRMRLSLVRSCVLLAAFLAVGGCVYLFWSLADVTKEMFFAWNAIGVVVYLVYGRTQSRLATA